MIYIATIYSTSSFDIDDRPVDPRVTVACIEFNRGIVNIQELGEWLQEKYPNLKHVYFEQNFGGDSPDDTWRNWPTFYRKLGLETLIVSDQQTSHDYIKQFVPPDPDDLGDNGIIEYQCDYEWNDEYPNQYPYWSSNNVNKINKRIPWCPGIDYQNHVVCIDNEGNFERIVWENNWSMKQRIRREECALLQTDPIYIKNVSKPQLNGKIKSAN